MTEAVFAAEPVRLIISAIAGIAILLILILKCKLHPVLSLLISALTIGLGSGMPVTTLMDTVEYGAGNTLQGIVLLIGLGSMFGGILEVSGGAQQVAQTMIGKFGEKKAGWALGITGLVVGTTVFFEAGVVVLIPLVFSGDRIRIHSAVCWFGIGCKYAWCKSGCNDCSGCSCWNHCCDLCGCALGQILRKAYLCRTAVQSARNCRYRRRKETAAIWNCSGHHLNSLGVDFAEHHYRLLFFASCGKIHI